MRIQLIGYSDCPGVPGARLALTQALTQCGLDIPWDEELAGTMAAPTVPVASPTILVNGADVGDVPPAAAACRMYASPDGRMVRHPPVEAIVRAIQAARPLAGNS